MAQIRIADRLIGDDYPTFVIAELSCNHLQSLDIARRTIAASREAGVDAVKLQHYTADTMTLPITSGEKGDFWIHGGTQWDGDWLYNLYRDASTPWEWTAELMEYAHSLGLICFSTPFDVSAVETLSGFDVPAYKIASFEMNDLRLLRSVAEQGRPVLFSTGMAPSLDKICSTIDVLSRYGCSQIGVLKCCSTYPARLEELHLSTIALLKREFGPRGVVVGISDHSLDSEVIVAAVALGARIVERHIILDRGMKDPRGRHSFDRDFSMEPDEFKDLVRKIRKVELIIGREQTGVTLSANQTKNLQFTRSLYFVKDIRPGEIITEDSIRAIRPGWGDDPANYPLYLGKVARQYIATGTRAALSLVE